MTLRRWYCAIALVALAAACGGQDNGAESAQEAAPATEAAEEEASPTDAAATEEETEEEAGTEEETSSDGAAAAGVTLMATSTDLGEVLADDQGNVVYVFDNDSGGESSCYDDCATNWPPLVGEVQAGEGVDESLLGTTERTDGQTQATYADRPLYYYAGDEQPGDTNGQGVGDVWWVVGPDGEAIMDAAAAAASAGEGY